MNFLGSIPPSLELKRPENGIGLNEATWYRSWIVYSKPSWRDLEDIGRWAYDDINWEIQNATRVNPGAYTRKDTLVAILCHQEKRGQYCIRQSMIPRGRV